MKTYILLIGLICFAEVCFAQKFKEDDSSSFYLICRGTKAKQNIVAEDFNLKDSLITHMGIGYMENNKLVVFNVSNFKIDEKGSALISEDFDSFVDLEDITYASVWRIKIQQKELTTLKQILSNYRSQTIKFDEFFLLEENNQYYCSEFVYWVLKELNPEKYNFTPTKKELNSFYSKALKRNTFEYIPVDFFETFNCVEKVYEKKFY